MQQPDQQPETERGEYGPPADVYRQIARGFNRPDYPFAAVLLNATSDGGIIPTVLNLFDARTASEWWGGFRLSGIFYGVLFDNQWLSQSGGRAKLVREYLHGGTWLGPMTP